MKISSRLAGPSQLLLLSKTVPWYGSHTGYYGMLPRHLEMIGASVRLIKPRRHLGTRLLGKFWSWRNRLPRRDQSLAEAEWRFLRQFRRTGGHGLILALEDFLPLLSHRDFTRGVPRNLIGVIHFPRQLWDARMLPLLGRLKSALVLYRKDIPFFEEHIGVGRVRFVPHGVDTDFFRPAEATRATRPAGPPRILVSGQFGRDYQLLLKAFVRLADSVPGVRLDIVGAHHAGHLPEVRRLASLPGVTLHARLSDEALLELYQTATLLLLPLSECGASNALVEALACGLPVVSTDTGGVRDYGGGTVFPVVPAGDDAALAAEVESLLRRPDRWQPMSAACRAHAERELAWPTSARRHLEAIESIGAA